MTILTEEERRAIVESGPVWLANGLRAQFAGIKIPESCGVSSCMPGFYACSWETAQEVVSRPDRRFTRTDFVWKTGNAWLGVPPRREDFQTDEDYARYTGEKR
jgi:hypothetical protein